MRRVLPFPVSCTKAALCAILSAKGGRHHAQTDIGAQIDTPKTTAGSPGSNCQCYGTHVAYRRRQPAGGSGCTAGGIPADFVGMCLRASQQRSWRSGHVRNTPSACSGRIEPPPLPASSRKFRRGLQQLPRLCRLSRRWRREQAADNRKDESQKLLTASECHAALKYCPCNVTRISAEPQQSQQI